MASGRYGLQCLLSNGRYPVHYEAPDPAIAELRGNGSRIGIGAWRKGYTTIPIWNENKCGRGRASLGIHVK